MEFIVRNVVCENLCVCIADCAKIVKRGGNSKQQVSNNRQHLHRHQHSAKAYSYIAVAAAE